MKSLHTTLTLNLTLLAISVASSQAQTQAQVQLPKGYLAHYAETPINIDGKISDCAWDLASWTDDFEDIEGDKKPRPLYQTRAKMLWDDNYLYIAAELIEPHIWGTLTEHDSVIFYDNDFEVFIEPDGDTHEYLEFEMNALNTGWDLKLWKPYRDGGPADNSWEIPGLKTAVQIYGTLNDPSDIDEKWTLEIAFPWKAMAQEANNQIPPKEGEYWRLGFSRVEWQILIEDGAYKKVPGKREDNWIWSPQGFIDMHRPETWGYVQFTKKSPGEIQFTRDPKEPIYKLLYQIYHAQKAYRKENNHWADSLKDLGLENDLVSDADLYWKFSEGKYWVGKKTSDGEGWLWNIRSDGKSYFSSDK